MFNNKRPQQKMFCYLLLPKCEDLPIFGDWQWSANLRRSLRSNLRGLAANLRRLANLRIWAVTLATFPD